MANLIENAITHKLSRRSFLGLTAGAAATIALPGCGLVSVDSKKVSDLAGKEGKWVTAACWHNCGSRCLNSAYVLDGVVVRQKTDDTHPDSPDFPQLRGCGKGRSQRKQVFSADRLKYPMKRKTWEPGGGNKELRGNDEWVRISWEEALDIVASETKRIKEKFGNESIYCPGGPEIQRTLGLYGGYVANYGSTSRGSWRTGQQPITGVTTQSEMNDRLDLQNAKLVVMWGLNPAWSSGGNPMYNYLQVKKAGAKFIFVDPFYSPSAAALADEWIPIRPATDTTFLLAIAYVMLTEDTKEKPLIDWDFLNRCTIGFDADHMPVGADPKENFKDYVLGTFDGQPKTPAWASEICGVSPEKIHSFAIELATTKPTSVLFGWNSARVEKSQHLPFAVISVGAMTGNMGISGGGFGVSCHDTSSNGGTFLINPGGSKIPAIKNPVKAQLCSNEHWDAILTGKYTAGKGGKKNIDIRMIYHGGGSKLNQTNNINKGVAAHRKVDFVVSNHYSLNTSSKYADIVLPITTQWERYGTLLKGNREILIFASQVIEPLYEAKDDMWVATEIGKRLGLDVKKIQPISLEQDIRDQVAGAKVIKDDGKTFESLVGPGMKFATYEDFKAAGIYQVPRKPGDNFGYIHNKAFRDDPVANPLPTKSGKLQLHSQELADLVTNAGWNTGYPIAKYVPPTEGFEATFSDWKNKVKGKYPLQLANIHHLRRAHSVMDNVTWLRESFQQDVIMNVEDGKARGISQGDAIRVFNAHGSVLRPVHLTERIIPGVIYLGEGAWADFDKEGNDKAGATNTLSGDFASGPDIESWQASVAQVEKVDKPLVPDEKWPQRIIF